MLSVPFYSKLKLTKLHNNVNSNSRPPKKDAIENLNTNEELVGQNILIQDPDPDLQSKKESTIVDDDDTTALDVTLR